MWHAQSNFTCLKYICRERNVDLSLPPCDNSLSELSGQMSLMSIASPGVGFDSTSSEKMEAASPPQKSSPSRTTETRQFDRIKSNLTRRQLSRILRPTDPANHSHQVEVCSSATNTSGWEGIMFNYALNTCLRVTQIRNRTFSILALLRRSVQRVTSPTARSSAWQLIRRNVASVATRWRHSARFDRPRIWVLDLSHLWRCRYHTIIRR